MDNKNHKNFVNMEKIKLYKLQDLENFKRNFLKANHRNQKIDSIFKNETEDLIHEMSMNEIINSNLELNCMKFMITKKKKKKKDQMKTKEQNNIIGKMKNENIFEMTKSELNNFKYWLKILSNNEYMQRDQFSIDSSFNISISNFSFLHNLNSKEFYLQNLFQDLNNKQFDFEQLLNFNWIQWDSKLDFFSYCQNFLKLFFKIFDFRNLKNFFKKFQVQNNLIKNFFEYNLENSFKENFMTFLIEIFLNFLQVFFFYHKIAKIFNLKFIDFYSTTMKSFLLKLLKNNQEIHKKLNSTYLIRKEKDCFINLEEIHPIIINEYFCFPSRVFDKSETTHKTYFIENLLNCRDILNFKKEFIISQNISQILLYQKLIKNIITEFSGKKKIHKFSIFDYYDLNYSITENTSFSEKFACYICKVKIHGLALICGKCHHGGHLHHIIQWFKNFNYCHECVKCQCIFNS